MAPSLCPLIEAPASKFSVTLRLDAIQTATIAILNNPETFDLHKKFSPDLTPPHQSFSAGSQTGDLCSLTGNVVIDVDHVANNTTLYSPG